MPEWRTNLPKSNIPYWRPGYFAICFGLLVIAGFSHAADEPSRRCEVPRAFKGRTFFILDSGREASEPLDIEIKEINAYGIFTGTFSRYSPFSGRPEVLCQESVRVPLEGFYNGYELSLHVKQSAKHPLCGDFNWRFTRHADGSFNVQGSNWRIELAAVCED